ncbi:MAG: hypothetical protein AAGG07_11560 [Planctomycetota bacterium]
MHQIKHAFAAIAVVLPAGVACAGMAPALVVTDTTYSGSVFAESTWLEGGSGSGFMRDSDSQEANDFLLAGGIGASSSGEGTNASADAFGAIGIGFNPNPGQPGGAARVRGFASIFASTQALGDAGQAISQADASATSELSVDFTLLNIPAGETQEVFIRWDLSVSQPISSVLDGRVEFELEMDSGSGLDDISRELEVAKGFGLPTSDIQRGLLLQLPAGSYTLTARASLDVRELQGDTVDSARADFDVLVVLPSPASATALMLGVIAARRRR